MFGALGSIFGSPKTIGKVVDAAVKGIDALKYTAEEKAHDAMQADKDRAERKMAFELQRAEIAYKAQGQVVAYMEATQGQNVARRFLAIGMFLFWMAVETTAVCLSGFAPWADTDTAARMLESATVIDGAIEGVDQYLMAIFLFYFSAPHISEALRGWFEGKRNGKPPEDATRAAD